MITDPTNIMLQDKLKLMLKEGNVEISFTKADGSTRNMTCTLNTDYILSQDGPIPKENEGSPDRPANPALQHVFDVTINDWRCFKWERLVSVNGNIINEQNTGV